MQQQSSALQHLLRFWSTMGGQRNLVRSRAVIDREIHEDFDSVLSKAAQRLWT